MYREVRIPRLGWSMEEGTFISWRKRDGDEVRAGEPLFELEGDKAIQEIEAVDSGTLRFAPDCPATGTVVAVGRLIGVLVPPGGRSPWEGGGALNDAPTQSSVDHPTRDATSLSQDFAAGASPSESGAASDSAGLTDGGVAPPMPVSAPAPVSARSVAASPRARRAARTHGIDLSQVVGGGRSGRIRERDVLATSRSSRATSSVTLLRRTIAERMKRSLAETAPVTLTSRADATNLVSLRRQFQAAAAGREVAVPSYTDIIAKLSAVVLERHPPLAARWIGDQLQFATAMHIGLAVDTPDGLLVPVLRDVRSKSLAELAKHSADLVLRARERRVSAEELHGGVFTITNLGAFGIDAFTPIINWPESSVLGIGAIRREAVVADQDRVEVRWQMTLSLTFDHRAVDGAPAARFLQELVGAIENPAAWLIG